MIELLASLGLVMSRRGFGVGDPIQQRLGVVACAALMCTMYDAEDARSTV
jgi:hypothetical protein